MRLVGFAALLVVLLLSAPTEAAYCNLQSNVTSPMNNNSIYDEAPVFVKRVTNGEMYTVGNAENKIHLLHVYGNDGYDFGYAAGTLLGDMAYTTMSGAYHYFAGEIAKELNKTGIDRKYNIPSWLATLIAEVGLDTALDVQNMAVQAFMDPQYYAEMRGMADATGLDYDMIVRVHLIGEITRGSCSLYGAYKSATLGGKTLQLRALDWDTSVGLQNYPTVTVYHPMNKSLGYPFANVGWAGWIGVLTGMSSNQIAISEIGVSFPGPDPNKNFGDESFFGIPFVFLERQIVQYGTSVYDAMDMIQNANRTCRLLLGVADANAQTARAVRYSHDIVKFYNDTDLEPNEWWHPRIPDVVYEGMDWICPYYQHLIGQQLMASHGRLTPELTIQNVTAVVGTGDLHAAVFDLTDKFLFVGNARGQNQTGPPFAYQRQFLKLNMTAHFGKSYGVDRL